MNPFKQIVVATDFSESAGRAVAIAAELAGRERPLTLIHAYAIPVPLYGYPMIALQPPAGEWPRDPAQAQLDAELARVRSSCPQATAVLRVGDARDAVLAVAEEQHADLIVVGSHGYSGFKRLMLGSVADGITRHAKVPVLVVRNSQI